MTDDEIKRIAEAVNCCLEMVCGIGIEELDALAGAVNTRANAEGGQSVHDWLGLWPVEIHRFLRFRKELELIQRKLAAV